LFTLARMTTGRIRGWRRLRGSSAGLSSRPGNWFRSYGNENWEFDGQGLMVVRHASINDLPITESERTYHWTLGRRPDDHPGLSDLGF
jgi:nuclear transport factor 2 (NTF2) superfamily protein